MVELLKLLGFPSLTYPPFPPSANLSYLCVVCQIWHMEKSKVLTKPLVVIRMTCKLTLKYAARRVLREECLKLYRNTQQRTATYLEWHMSHRDQVHWKNHLLGACHIAGGILCGMHTKSGPLFLTTFSLMNSKYSHLLSNCHYPANAPIKPLQKEMKIQRRQRTFPVGAGVDSKARALLYCTLPLKNSQVKDVCNVRT